MPGAPRAAGGASRARNVGLALGLGAFTTLCALFPLWYSQRFIGKNLQRSKEPLTGSQVIRGAYINTGSKDAGPDPDWDLESKTWRGRPSISTPDALAKRQ